MLVHFDIQLVGKGLMAFKYVTRLCTLLNTIVPVIQWIGGKKKAQTGIVGAVAKAYPTSIGLDLTIPGLYEG